MSGINLDDFNRGDFTTGDLVSAGFKPPGGGGGGGGGGGPWYADATVTGELESVYDFRGQPAGSTLTLDANNAVSTVSDLGDQGNDGNHWRGTGLQVEKALLRTDGNGVQGIYCSGEISSDEKHWGVNHTNTYSSAATSWHSFAVLTIPSTATFLAAGSGSSGSVTVGYSGIGSSGSGGRPYLRFADSGGAAASSWQSTVNGGGGQISNANPGGGTTINIESAVDRGNENIILVEWRLDGSALQQIWVNGLKLNEGTVATPDAMFYSIWGKRDLNINGQPLQLYALGFSQQTHPNGLISTTQAATIRSAIMNDFGLTLWDGSTYPL